MKYVYGIRRYLLIDEYKGKHRIAGRFWTEIGLRHAHHWLNALLMPSNSEAKLLMHDQKTDQVTVLTVK